MSIQNNCLNDTYDANDIGEELDDLIKEINI